MSTWRHRFGAWLRRRSGVPYKQQMTDSDCGPSCLAMVVAYYGKELSVYSARQLCEEFGQPQSTRSIIRAARSLGMDASLMACDIDALSAVELPCIIHWNFSHFVVLERARGGKFTITDPALGRRTVTLTEFDLSFTGIAIGLKPGVDFTPGNQDRNVRFRAFLRETLGKGEARSQLMRLCGFALAFQLLSLAGPIATMYIVDDIIAYSLSDALLPMLAVISLLAASAAFFVHFRARATVALQYLVDRALLSGYFKHTLSLPLSYFADRSTPELQSRMNSNTVIRDALSTHTVSAFLDLTLALSYLGILAFTSPSFAALAFILALGQLVVHLASLGRSREAISSEMKRQVAYQAFATEVFNGIVTVKSAGIEERIASDWNAYLEDYLSAARRRSEVDASVSTFTTAFKVASPLLLLLYSASLVLNAEMTLGAALAINTIAAMALVPLASLFTSIRHAQMVRVHAERIGDVWRHPSEIAGDSDCPPLGSEADIVFDAVSFRYKSASDYALREVSFRLVAGTKLGVVGPSGSGKSTLLSIVLGTAVPASGRITIGDIPASQIDPKSFRKQIAYVPQDGFVFNTSIRENIEFGSSALDFEQVHAALKTAALDDVIAQLPMGLETRVGEFGFRVSGGQRQRIAVARAAARRPQLLILDEATSSLDSVTEQIVSARLAEIPCTQLIVSHRVSSVMACDRILVMESGRIAASGTHAELLKLNAFYRECCIAQGLQNHSPELVDVEE